MIKLYDILKEVKKIPDEYIRKIAKQYDNKPISDFYTDHKSLFTIIYSRGKEYFDDVTKNMVRKTKKWTDEEIEREAKKYKHIKDFEEGSPKAFSAAKNRGMLKRKKDPKTGKIYYDPSFYRKITAHMTPLGNLKKRIIYVHEFTDENNKPVAAYVGLTFNSQLRYKQHTTGVDKLGKLRDTQVTKFIRENPTLKHTYKELTGFLETDEAVKQEQFWEDKYKDDGWLILGKKRAGSLGNTYTVQDSDLKDFVDAQAKQGLNLTDLFKKYPNQVNLIYHRGLHKPPYNYLEKFERTVASAYTDESAFEKAMTYNSNGEIMNKDPKLYQVLAGRKLLAKVRQAFEERNKTSIKVDEAKVVPATNLFQKYQYKVGDIVQEMYGNEELAKVIDIRPNYSAVEKNPIDMGFIPMWLERDTGELDNNPWYLLEWLGSNRNANRKTWWPESEIQIPDHDDWPIGDDDD